MRAGSYKFKLIVRDFGVLDWIKDQDAALHFLLNIQDGKDFVALMEDGG
jgi:hypothetical protein